MSKVAMQYLQTVNRMIHCPRSQKKEFLCQLEDEIFLYCEEHADSDIDALEARFGTPEEIADNFLSEIGTQAIRRSNLIRQRLLLIVALAVIITAAAVISGAVYVQHKFMDSYFVESITFEAEQYHETSCPTFDITD